MNASSQYQELRQVEINFLSYKFNSSYIPSLLNINVLIFYLLDRTAFKSIWIGTGNLLEILNNLEDELSSLDERENIAPRTWEKLNIYDIQKKINTPLIIECNCESDFLKHRNKIPKSSESPHIIHLNFTEEKKHSNAILSDFLPYRNYSVFISEEKMDQWEYDRESPTLLLHEIEAHIKNDAHIESLLKNNIKNYFTIIALSTKYGVDYKIDKGKYNLLPYKELLSMEDPISSTIFPKDKIQFWYYLSCNNEREERIAHLLSNFNLLNDQIQYLTLVCMKFSKKHLRKVFNNDIARYWFKTYYKSEKKRTQDIEDKNRINENLYINEI